MIKGLTKKKLVLTQTLVSKSSQKIKILILIAILKYNVNFAVLIEKHQYIIIINH